MIWDNVLFPGSQIEYFVTSFWDRNPNGPYYFLPDTTGGFFLEFEVLPGLRTAYVPGCGELPGFDYCVFQPATLYIDCYNRGAQFFVENALRTILNGEDPCIEEEGCEIPKDRNWDRYDYLDGSSNWNAPFVRGSVAGSNNGMTLNQVLGYRTFLLNFGTLGQDSAQDEDYALYDQWLNSPDCNANVNRQGFIANGDKAGSAIEEPGGIDIEGHGLAFLNGVLGATVFCEAFNGITDDPNCAPPDTSFCVRYLPVAGGPFTTETDIDGYGNYCPNLYGFNVFGLTGDGEGNRYYRGERADGKEMFYAQVCNDYTSVDPPEPGNYRTVLDGISWHHMTKRVDAGSPDDLNCPRDTPSIVDGSLSEIRAAMNWIFDVGPRGEIPLVTNAKILAVCQGTWTIPVDVGDEPMTLRVNRLYQNEPNPFNPRTVIKFSLAHEGPVKITIYDVSGRQVKTLVDGKAKAGLNSVVWDGTDDNDHKVGSGVYWSQMKVGAFLSNKKMVILK
jgi:hypothetical protein